MYSPNWARRGEDCEGPRTGSFAGMTRSRLLLWCGLHYCLCFHAADWAAVKCPGGCACPCGSTEQQRPER